MNNSKLIRVLGRASLVILLLTAFIFGIKQLREPDIFWQLRTGEWIVKNHRIMDQDIFSFTFHGVPWINVKWGFEVLLYFMYKLGGVAFTPVLQCFASITMVITFWQIFKFFYMAQTGKKPGYPQGGFIIALILFLLACGYRMNGRPEMISHVLTGIFLLILLRERARPSAWVYLLLPLEMIWANMHEAYGTGEVILCAMLLWAWIEYFYKKREKVSVPLKLSLITILAISATAIGPYGLKMIIHPYDIFSQVEANKFTTELYSFLTPEYWQKEAWLNIVFLLLALAGLFAPFQMEPIQKRPQTKQLSAKWFWRPFENYGPGYIMLLALFFYLSLTAYRNIIFFIIVSSPLAANSLCYFGDKLTSTFKLLSYKCFIIGVYLFLLALSLLFYASVPTNLYYSRVENQNNHYGLRVDPLMNPIGAAAYIKKNNITGKCFDDFLISNYLLWELKPDFKTFIDLRDLDVFPASFFKDFALISHFPKKLDQVDSLYHFNYAVIYRNNFQNLHNYFYHNKNWAMVYADPVSVLFLKRNSENNSLVAKSLTDYPDGDAFTLPAEQKPSYAATFFTQLFWPGASTDYNKNTDYNLIAASYYLSVGNAAIAEKRANISIANGSPGANAFMGDILLYRCNIDTVQSLKQTELASAENDYDQELDHDKKNVKALIGLGRIAMQKNDFSSALVFLQRSIQYDAHVKDAYILLANCLSHIAGDDKEKQDKYNAMRINAMEKALSIDPDDISLKFYLGLYYGENGDCEKAATYLKQTINIPGFPAKDKQEARRILLQCGEN